MGRREDKREATRQDILSAASDLFRDRGYDATSVDDIVMAANLAKGTFYYHFQKKDDLILALQEAQLKVAADAARRELAGGESPKRVLFNYLSEAAHWTEANSEIARAMARHKFEQMHKKCDAEAHSGPPPSIKALFFDLIAEIIEKAQNAGEIRRDMTAAEIAQVLIPVVMSARMSWVMHQKGSLTELMERSMRIMFEGLRS